jgi:energy-coupling factor transporter ATP-binding protein EcfA2
MKKKTAIFVIGQRSSGKSTIIRSLTGVGRNKVHKVKNNKGEYVRAFAFLMSIQEIGMTKYPPASFLEQIEKKTKINRKDYDVLICPLRLVVREQETYGYPKYIQSTKNKGFDVKLVVIEVGQNGTKAVAADISIIKSYVIAQKIPILLINASGDPNNESSKLKDLYP